jgi:branched-chain amino acid transport system substrate-binding protein
MMITITLINLGSLSGQSFLSQQRKSSVIEREDSSEIVSGKYLTEDILDSIEEMIEEKKIKLALRTLLKQPVKFEDDLNSDNKSALLKTRQWLLLRVHYLSGHYRKTISIGRRYFQKFKTGSNFHLAYYLFASALNRLNLPLEYKSSVSEELLDNLSSEKATQLKLYLLQDALKQKKIEEAFSYFKKLDVDETVTQQWLNKIIHRIDIEEQIAELLKIYDGSTIGSKLYLREAEILINKGSYQKAAEYLIELSNSGELGSGYYDELSNLQDFLQTALEAKPNKIGVILPFTHQNRWFRFLANQVKDGLELALRNFELKGGEPVQLIFKDSTRPRQNKTSMSKQTITERHISSLVKELVEQDNVIAILGPMAKNTSIAAGVAAEPYRTPVISFSLTENIGRKHPYLFRFQRSRNEEVKTLVNYAMDYLGAKRFVLLYPASKSGFNSMKAFSDAVIARKGKVVGIAKVLRKQVDFQDMFMNIARAGRKVSAKERKEAKLARERLMPVINFDAIYAPLPPDKLNIIGSFLDLFGAEKIWILGDSTTNVKENRIIEYSRRLRFVDTFSTSQTKGHLSSFYENHWRYFNFRKSYIEPTTYAFYGYEALELLIKLLNNSHNQTGTTLKKSLDNLYSFPVLTGDVSRQKNGELRKELKLLQIKRRRTVSIFDRTGR